MHLLSACASCPVCTPRSPSLVRAVGAVALLLVSPLARVAAAQTGVPPFRDRAPVAIQRVRDAQTFCLSPQGGPTLDRQITCRDSVVAGVFRDFEATRRAEYGAYRESIESTKKCASTPGQKHYCPMSIPLPENMEPVAIENINDDFDGPSGIPSYNGHDAVQYVVKKTGKGSNVAGFRAQLRYGASAVMRLVNNEVRMLRRMLTARGLPHDGGDESPNT